MKVWYCVATSYDDRGIVISNLVDTKKAEEKPENTFKSTKTKDIYLDWFGTLREANSHIAAARLA